MGADRRSEPTVNLPLPRSWADGITPVSFEVTCGGDVHQLLWRSGELLTPAHPDPEAERALAGLGGEPCRCVELLDAWTACATDPRVLVLGPRGSDCAPAWPDSPGRRARLARAGRLDPLTTILSLGDELPRRLVATVAHALTAHVVNPALFPMLHVAVYGRVLTSLRRWTRASPELVLELVPPGDEPSLTGSSEGGFVARLPFSWLTEVWARELDVVSGRFTLAALTEDGVEWTLLSVGASLRPQTCWYTPA